jgi:hypothetical protein
MDRAGADGEARRRARVNTPATKRTTADGILKARADEKFAGEEVVYFFLGLEGVRPAG